MFLNRFDCSESVSNMLVLWYLQGILVFLNRFDCSESVSNNAVWHKHDSHMNNTNWYGNVFKKKLINSSHKLMMLFCVSVDLSKIHQKKSKGDRQCRQDTSGQKSMYRDVRDDM